MALRAFIDESGQIGTTNLSSDHFVMSALVCRDVNLPHLQDLLLATRKAAGRGSNQRLSWKKIKDPTQRFAVAELLGRASFVRFVSIVVCKRQLQPPMKNSFVAYLYTLRFLLERLSWLGRKYETVTSYTLSHVKHFRAENLRYYESKLREMGGETEIKWQYLDPEGGRISNDRTIESLQLADSLASATARAFEPNDSGPADPSYFLQLVPRLYRGPKGPNAVTSYGLKMHPWNEKVRTSYDWVAQLR